MRDSFADSKGHPKDFCAVCKRHVDECVCPNLNGHPIGCTCRWCAQLTFTHRP